MPGITNMGGGGGQKVGVVGLGGTILYWRVFNKQCLSLSGSFTPSRHLRPSSGWEHTVIYLTGIQSGDNDYLMDETRRKPTTGTQCPGTGTDTTGHTKAFDYPVMDHWGKSKCSSTRQILTISRVYAGCSHIHKVCIIFFFELALQTVFRRVWGWPTFEGGGAPRPPLDPPADTHRVIFVAID